jgi:hypothetical protein
MDSRQLCHYCVLLSGDASVDSTPTLLALNTGNLVGMTKCPEMSGLILLWESCEGEAYPVLILQ